MTETKAISKWHGIPLRRPVAAVGDSALPAVSFIPSSTDHLNGTSQRAWLINKVKEEITARGVRPSNQDFEKLLRLGGRDFAAGRNTRESVAYQFMMQYPSQVLYEDDDLLLINKPTGMLSHANPGSKFGLEHIVQYVTNSDVCLVNRLDGTTSGLIMMAKNFGTLIEMKQQFGDKEESGMRKIYLALLDGEFDSPEEVRVDVSIAESGNGKMRVVEPDEPGAKDSTTFFTPLVLYQTQDDPPQTRTLASVRIITGRTHQIRVVASHKGVPVVGDNTYNLNSSGRTRMMLHSFGLRFKHPSTGEEMTVSTEKIPDDFEEVVAGLVRVKSYQEGSE